VVIFPAIEAGSGKIAERRPAFRRYGDQTQRDRDTNSKEVAIAPPVRKRLMEYTQYHEFDWVGKEKATKAAQRSRGVSAKGNARKENEDLEGVLEIWRTGTGTQICSLGHSCGRRKRLVWNSRVRACPDF